MKEYSLQTIFVQNQTRGLFGNWTFLQEDDFTLPDGTEKRMLSDKEQLASIHDDFAVQCKLFNFDKF